MAKLDEIAELLTEEIKEFENSISRLEELHAFLRNYKIKPDTSDIDFILRQYNDHQKKAIDDQHKLMGNVIYYIKKSMTFPKWATKLFCGLLVIIFLVLGYSIYKVSRIPEIKQEAYGQGEKKAVGHFRAFFEASPEASELYQKCENPKAKSRVRPIRFLLYANLPESLQKPDRIHAQSFWVSIWDGYIYYR